MFRIGGLFGSYSFLLRVCKNLLSTETKFIVNAFYHEIYTPPSHYPAESKEDHNMLIVVMYHFGINEKWHQENIDKAIVSTL
jgi:hypothetical protein